MDIVIIGDGKVGHKLAMQLSEEKNSVTLIDQCEKKLADTVNEMDVSCVAGDGGSAEVQKRADVPGADLVIACTSTDEMNLFCCLLARRLGAKQTIARVRNPVYADQMHLLKEDLKLSMAVNPERALAGEISRVLLFPSAAKIETFAKGRVELVEVALSDKSVIAGLPLSSLYTKYQIKMLICAVQRGARVFIPDGSFVLQPGDKINIAASHKEIEKFFFSICYKLEISWSNRLELSLSTWYSETNTVCYSKKYKDWLCRRGPNRILPEVRRSAWKASMRLGERCCIWLYAAAIPKDTRPSAVVCRASTTSLPGAYA